jgi:hypothetical protein
MASTRYTDGNVTVTLDDGLERWMRSILSGAEAQMVAEAEAVAAKVAADAEAVWYQDVTRRTGRSGDLDVTTTFDGRRNVVRVSIVSKDTRRDKRKPSRPLAVLVHRPGRLSQVRTEITAEEYWAAVRGGKKKSVVHARTDGKYYRFVDNPKASDGKTLMVERVRKPFTVAIKAAIPGMAARVADRINGGRDGR